jgi:type VI secretion system secreted protein VgrG
MPGQDSLLTISTPLGEDALLLRKATVTEALGSPFQIDIELCSENEEISIDDLLGQNVGIRLETENGSRFFNGIVTEFFQKDNIDRNAFYGAVVRPWLWLLTLTENCRIFQEKTYPDIIKAVFDDLGFSDFEYKLTGNYQSNEYVVQFNESDFNFVSRIMQQEGMFYYFRHDNGKHVLVLTDDSSSLPDNGEVPFFELDEDSIHEGVEGITCWQNHRQVRTGGISLSSYDFELPTKNLSVATADQKTASLSSLQKYRYPGKYSERAAGDNYTNLLMQKENSVYEQKHLSGNLRSLFSGAQFKLVDYPREDQNAQYVITAYSCTMKGETFMADKTDEDKTFFAFSASAIPAKTPFRCQLDAVKPKMTGPQTATVVGKPGEEIWTDKYGRIKVLFHWDRLGEADETSSCWIRVSQSLAGKNWGSMYIPRIGQEVLVDFLNGDPDQPIVIGCVYNGASMPPHELPEHATMTGFKSRSSKGGAGFNEIRFEDKKGEEQIYIHGQHNQDIRINNDCFETIGNDRHLTIENDQFEKVKHNRNEDVGDDHIENIGKDRNLSVAGKEAKSVGETLSLIVEGDISEDFKENYSVNVGGDTYMKASNICLEASSNITFKVGGSSIAIESGGITMSTSGSVKIEGKAGVKVDSAAPAEISASGPLTLKGAMVKIN